MKRHETLKELWAFARQRKAVWLAPLVIAIVLFGLLLLFASSTPVAPFVYTLF